MRCLSAIMTACYFSVAFAAMADGQPLTYSIVEGAGDVPLLVGEGGNPDGPAVLFVHGMSQSHLAFLPQFESDLTDDYRLIAYDLRGHGGSGKPWRKKDYAAKKKVWAKDLAAVVNAKGLKDFTIVAWSFGGYVAADYIRHYGADHVKALHLTGTLGGLIAFDFPQTPDSENMMAGVRQRAALDLKANITGYASMPDGFTLSPMPQEAKMLAVATGHMLPSYVRRAMTDLPLENTDLAKELTVPVLISIGFNDMAAPVAAARELTKQLPHSALSIYADAKHFPSLEDTRRFNCELRSLIETGAPNACAPSAAFKQAPTKDQMRARYASDGISQFITIDGTELHYRDKGGDKPVVLLLPGHMGNTRMFDGWLPHLENDFRPIALDWPPYGLSLPDPSGVYSSQRGAELVIGFLEKMGIRKAALVGTSNGATVAAHVGAMRPDLVTKLALSTFPLGAPPKRVISPDLIEQAKLHFGNKTYRPESLFRAILEDIFYDPEKVTDDLVQQYTDMNNHPGGYAAQDIYVSNNRAMYAGDNWPQIYKKITAPTLIQWGDGGIVMPANLAQGSVDVLENASVRLIRYPQSGHMPMLEQPDKTGRDLTEFLRARD